MDRQGYTGFGSPPVEAEVFAAGSKSIVPDMMMPQTGTTAQGMNVSMPADNFTGFKNITHFKDRYVPWQQETVKNSLPDISSNDVWDAISRRKSTDSFEF